MEYLKDCHLEEKIHIPVLIANTAILSYIHNFTNNYLRSLKLLNTILYVLCTFYTVLQHSNFEVVSNLTETRGICGIWIITIFAFPL